MRMRALGLLIAAVPLLLGAAAEPGRVCVIQGPGQMARADLSAVVLRAVRVEVEGLFAGQVQPTPPIDFEGLQLALGCMGESPACMTALARQVQADTLVIVRVADLDGGIELILERVEAVSGLRVASERRRVPADAGGARIVDVVPEAVPVLFGRAPPPPQPVALARGPSPYPFVTAGAGAAALVVGAVFGGLAASAESDYAAHSTNTAGEVNAALQELDRAEGRATAANVFFVVGGALVTGGVAWLIVELSSDGPTTEEVQ